LACVGITFHEIAPRHRRGACPARPMTGRAGVPLWREVAERVFVRSYPDFRVNVGLILGGEAALVVDTRASARQGLELRYEIEGLTGLPLIVVNTHHHWDHVLGNAAFAPAETWGHWRCADRMVAEADATRTALAAAMPELAAEYADTEVVPPNRTVNDRATIDLGARTVELFHPGRAHTDNDLAVIVADARVVFAGDLVEAGAPPSFEDSYPMAWPGALAKLLERVDGAVVPGHGPIVDGAYVAAQMGQLKALAELSRGARFDGRTVQDAMPGSPFVGDVGRQALERAFAQLDGEI
jgi:glyoxylase-like metal-dependent hydrolase (beta-lactamase superfamily II)